MRAELKKWKITRARKTSLVSGFSNVVAVKVPGEQLRFVKIDYDESFLVDLGKLLPQGLQSNRPAYLFVQSSFCAAMMFVSYVDTREPFAVCRMDQLPEWAKKATRKKHDCQKAADPANLYS